MHTFYNAKQQPGESVATWACRLETLITKAIAAGQISGTSFILSSGLICKMGRSRLSLNTGMDNNIDSLFHKVRMAEQEFSPTRD